MANSPEKDTVILKENSEWLRYVFWAGAIGLGVIAIQAFNAESRDYGKVIGSGLGVLLLGFSGFVLKTRAVKVDPLRREITIISKGFRESAKETVPFDDIKQILLVLTMAYDSELLPANRWQEGWTLALVCRDRNVALTVNPALHAQALKLAERVQRLTGVDIGDSVVDSIDHLLTTGRKIDAIALATQRLGMTTTQAKDFVEGRLKMQSGR